ncbi:protein of unknown function [Pseudomonas mediterranea]
MARSTLPSGLNSTTAIDRSKAPTNPLYVANSAVLAINSLFSVLLNMTYPSTKPHKPVGPHRAIDS